MKLHLSITDAGLYLPVCSTTRDGLGTIRTPGVAVAREDLRAAVLACQSAHIERVGRQLSLGLNTGERTAGGAE